MGVTVASKLLHLCIVAVTSLPLHFASTTGCEIHIVRSEAYSFCEAGIQTLFSSCLLLSGYDSLIIYQGYTISFGSSIMYS